MIRCKSQTRQLLAALDDRTFNCVLYVGAYVHGRRPPNGLKELRRISKRIDCMEIWPKCVYDVQEKGWFDDVFQGDLTQWNNGGRYDAIVWWHGPEHVAGDMAKHTLLRLPTLAPFIVVSCPYGECVQGMRKKNPFQRHLSTWYPEEFISMGYGVSIFGDMMDKDANIVAWYPAHRNKLPA